MEISCRAGEVLARSIGRTVDDEGSSATSAALPTKSPSITQFRLRMRRAAYQPGHRVAAACENLNDCGLSLGTAPTTALARLLLLRGQRLKVTPPRSESGGATFQDILPVHPGRRESASSCHVPHPKRAATNPDRGTNAYNV